MSAIVQQLGMFAPANASLRHRDRRQIWYDNHEDQPRLQVGRYEIVVVTKEWAKGFLAQHHYLGGDSFAAFAGLCHGIRDKENGDIVGVASYGPGGAVAIRPAAFPNLFDWVLKPNKRGKMQKTPVERQKGSCAVLDRFCMLDEVPANAETHVLKLSFARAREENGVRGVVSFSDPVPRTTIDGRVLFLGHLGISYRAKGLIYTGTTGTHEMVKFHDGTVLPSRSLCKWRNAEGQEPHVYARLLRQGATPMLAGQERAEWLDSQLPLISTPFTHTGCLRYLAVLDSGCQISPRLVREPYPTALAA